DCDDEIKQNQQSISGHLWRGFIYEQKRDAARAIADYQQALAIDPGAKIIHIPPAIGQTLEDVRAYLARLQGSAAAGGGRARSIPTRGDARPILEKRGLLGVWAADCSVPASPQNTYTVYRAIDERRVQRDVMIGPTQRIEAGIIEPATHTGDGIAYLQTGATRDETIMRVAGNRPRVAELARNGTNAIANGSYLPAYGDAALIGRETPWANKCQ